MTIAKNTKKAQAAIKNAKNIRCFSLANNFSGKPLDDQPHVWGGEVRNGCYTKLVPVTQSEFLQKELDGYRVKLTTSDNRHFCIQVHSNLWYDFEAELAS